jgi:hypothetical protein
MRALPPVSEEFQGCIFPDARLHQRVVKLVGQLEVDPQLSFPEAFRDASQLEGTYRFLGNRRVDLPSILGGHIANTVSRVSAAGRALAIHDTTSFSFDGDREGLGLVDQKQQGFYAHGCLAVSADETREPLGLLALDTWIRTEKKGKRTIEQRKKDPSLESKRWLQQSLDVEALMPSGTQLVHVEDREGDIFESFAERRSKGMHFIVRATSSRLVLDEDGEATNVLQSARQMPIRFSRSIHLSARSAKHAHLPQAQHRNRKVREADVDIRADVIRLRAPKRGGSAPELVLNAVYVGERDTPKGEEPVEWLLFTTEPIRTKADVEWVIDSYRTRWLIEEYFKALKTGCKYEERQLESLGSLLNALGLFAIIAWRLLVLRHLERTVKDSPAETVATESELAVLIAQKRLKPGATAKEFLVALARYGGHLKQNGPPGLLILWRALRALQALAEGWLLAQRSDQS